MDFAENYGCRSQNEIQSVYWSPIQITIPAVMYYKTQNSAESSHKSFVFISNESRHDAMFAYIIIGKLVLLLKEIVPYLERCIIGPIPRQVSIETVAYSK